MIISAFDRITKSFGGAVVFEELSFEIHASDRIGLVGQNGSGKTTIFHILAGIEQADKGQCHLKKGLKIGHLAQISRFNDHLLVNDVLHNAFHELMKLGEAMKTLEEEMKGSQSEEAMQRLLNEYGKIQDQYVLSGGYEIESNIQKVVNGLQIQALVDQTFGALSGGEKTKVGLAYILLQQPDLLLLDEPTNHLDIDAVEWLEQFLREYDGTVVVISHDRYFLDEVATKIFELDQGELFISHHNYSGFLKEKEEKLLLEFQAYQEQQKKIKKMKETIKRLKEWANQANPPNAGLHRRARSMQKALDRIEQLRRPVLERKRMKLQFEQGARSGKDVIRMENVEKIFNQTVLLQDVNLHLQFQERAIIVGKNGAGKSTLLKLILDEHTADSGRIERGSNVKIGYLSQHIEPTYDSQTVIEAFRDVVSVTEGEARHILATFLFYGYAVFQKVKDLSGGEKMRLRLAQLMYQDVNLLILDEPTNHLDIESREVLEDALEHYEGTILAVSHDRYFLNKLSETTYWVEDNTLYRFAGNYTWAKQKVAERQKSEEKRVPKEKEEIKPPRVKNILPIVQEYKVEEEIEEVEALLQAIQQQLLVEKDLGSLQSLYEKQLLLEEKREELYNLLE